MLPRIKTGQEAKVKIDGTEQTLSGKISWINAKAEFTPKTILTPETRTSLVYAAKVLIQNPDHILKPLTAFLSVILKKSMISIANMI